MPLQMRHEFTESGEDGATLAEVAHGLLGFLRAGVSPDAPFRVTKRTGTGAVREIGAQLQMADEHPDMAPAALEQQLEGDKPEEPAG